MAGFPKGAVALFFCVCAVAACNATPPNDVASGVGFQDYQQWQARRAMLRGDMVAPPVAAPAPPRTAAIRPPIAPVTAALPPLSQPPRAAANAAPPAPQVAVAPVLPRPAPAAAAAPLPAPAPAAPRDDMASIAAAAIAAAEAEVETAAQAPTPPAAPLTRGTSTRISDEQDFDAVAARESIESDAERLARMQAERVVIAPTAIPQRPADIGPNIIDYALATSHPVGERRHTRRPITQARHARACMGFRSADLAQEWFLQNGGPGRDRQGLDPDGDGYACDWDPGVYRAAAAAAARN